MSEIEAVVEAVHMDDLEAAEVFCRDVLWLGASAGRRAARHLRVSDAVLLAFNPEDTLRGDILPPHGAVGARRPRGAGRVPGRLAGATPSPRGRRREGGRVAEGRAIRSSDRAASPLVSRVRRSDQRERSSPCRGAGSSTRRGWLRSIPGRPRSPPNCTRRSRISFGGWRTRGWGMPWI